MTNAKVFFFFVILSILWYLQAYEYGFISDFIGWVEKYQNGNYSDVIHCFGYNGLHQFFHFVNYSVYKLFGINELSWSVLFSCIHGVNAFLVYSYIKVLLKRWSISLYGIEWFVALLFLVAPFQIEVLTWNACLHYLLSLLFLLVILLQQCLYLIDKKRYRLIFIHGIFLAALFTLEINLSIPFMVLAILFFDHFRVQGTQSVTTSIGYLVVPQLVMLVGYFLLNQFILGDWIGHYGSDVHLSMPMSQMFGHAWAYVLQHAVYLDLFEYNTQKAIYSVLFKPVVSYSLLALCFVGLGLAIRFFHRLSDKVQLAGIFLILFFMALVPILSLYYYFDTPFKNDRYLYYASPFLFLSICAISYHLRYSFRYSFLILYLIAHSIFSRANIKSTALAAEGADFMLQNFPCEQFEGKTIYLLGLADNFRGCYLYSEYSDEATSFTKAMAIKYPTRPCHVHIINPAQYNLKFASDGLGAQYVDDKTIKVFIKQGGTWFWRHGRGMASYETDDYRVENNGWFYLLKFKKPLSEAVFLYPEGAEWKALEK